MSPCCSANLKLSKRHVTSRGDLFCVAGRMETCHLPSHVTMLLPITGCLRGKRGYAICMFDAMPMRLCLASPSLSDVFIFSPYAGCRVLIWSKGRSSAVGGQQSSQFSPSVPPPPDPGPYLIDLI